MRGINPCAAGINGNSSLHNAPPCNSPQNPKHFLFTEMSRCRLNGVTVMPHGLTTVTGNRAGCREDSNDAAHRDRRAYSAGDIQQEYLPAMQRLAARSRLVRTSQ